MGMPAEIKKPSASTELDDAALQLVDAVNRESTPAALAALADFQQRSAAHAQAVTRAQRFFELSGSMRREPTSVFRSLALYADLWWARLIERRVGVALAVVAVASIGLGLVFVSRMPAGPATAPPAVANTPKPVSSYQTRRHERREVRCERHPGTAF